MKRLHLSCVTHCLLALILLRSQSFAQTPVAGQALRFDGVDDFVRVLSNPIPINGNFTIECWAYASPQSSGFRTILSQATSPLDPRFYIGLDPSGQIRAGDAWVSTGVTLPLDSWHHLALVRSATNTLLYFDGSLKANFGSAIPNPSAAPWMDIGQQFDDLAEFWNGNLDELRIWKTARTAAQITANASKRLTGSEAGLAAYYRFDNTSGLIATNSATTGAIHNGTLTNGPVWFGLAVVTNAFDSGPGTLRQAVVDASSGDYITFATNLSGATILLTSGVLYLDKSLVIDASMLSGGVKLDGNHADRVFVNGSGATSTLTSLTIFNGLIDGGYGGGVQNLGSLKMNRCTVLGNACSGSNLINEAGAGVFSLGTLTMNQCTVVSNSTAGNGGGIFNYGGVMNINQCTVIGNTASDTGFGGGGGVINTVGGTMTLSNSIVCNNTAPANANLVGSYAGTGNFVDDEPKLSPLGNYGGPTQTMPPLPGSPVIDGATGTYFATDQRGLPRDLDGNGDGVGVNDIGAVEFQASPIITTLTDSGEGSLRAAIASSPNGSTITFSNILSGGIIALTSGQLPVEKNLTIDGSALSPGITIDGNHASRIFQSGGGAHVVLNSLTIANGTDIGGGNDGGGGILNYGALTLNNCTLTGNSSSHNGWGGGGILSYQGTLSVNQCTFWGNSAPDSAGGGIITYSGTLVINQSTVSGNSAVFGGGIVPGGTTTMSNSIVVGNTAASSADIAGSFTGGNNFTDGDPMLAPFGNYGGPTATFSPLPGSPVIDAVSSTFATDQRGFARTVDGDTNGVAVADIGAVEFKPMSPVRGSYAGLFGESSGARHVSSGLLSVQVTAGRAYTAKLMIAGKTYPYSGKFDRLGRSIKTVSRKGLPPVTVKLYCLAADQIYGRISDGTWTAEFVADRLTFNSKTNRAPAAGKYTMRIRRGSAGMIVVDARQVSAVIDSSVMPAGDGFGAVTISSGGTVTFAGTLADGTKISQGTFLNKDNQWPFYASPYNGAGSVLGWQNFATNTPKSFSGEVLWTKISNAGAKTYSAGFTNRSVTVGSQYITPPKGTRILDIPSTASIGFNDAGVSKFSNSVLLGTNNKIVNLGSNKLTMVFTLTSGVFSGTVVDPLTLRTISFRGAVSQNDRVGFGFFINTNQSGALQLTDH